MSVWNRRAKEYFTPIVYKERATTFFHENFIGRFLMKHIASNPLVSVLLSQSKFKEESKKEIVPFIQRYNIDVSQFLDPVSSYKTFNEFFIRRLKPDARPITNKKRLLASPADSQLSVYQNIGPQCSFTVKGTVFTVDRLLGDKNKAKEYANGTLLLFYLAPNDYHRYHYPTNGTLHKTYRKGNKLFAVNRFAFENGFRPFDYNVRDINIMENKYLGEFMMVEIGATLIGRMEHTNTVPGEKVKGDEKGYFSFGGSSVILLFKENTIKVDDDILEQLLAGHSVFVHQGEDIAKIG